MQKVYLFFYRLISIQEGTNVQTETFHKTEIILNGEIISIDRFDEYELWILTTKHPGATLVQITGCMPLRDSELKLTKPRAQEKASTKNANTRGKKRNQL